MSMNKKSTEKLKEPLYYVGIGASAGGLEAIVSLIKNLPSDTGLAFIIIQHLSPDHKSLMSELLSKHTTMPVYRAEDNLRVESNSIYLLIPRKSLRIFHGNLLLSDMDQSEGIHLPIDLLLKSLAEDKKEKAIAIILSGTGSDGTRGCRAIKEFGGMIMVQDEHSAKFDGMPKSVITTGLPDFILPPEEMPKQLEAYVKYPFSPKDELSPSLVKESTGLSKIFSILREQTKVDFTHYKPNTIVRRIERRMSVNQLHELNDYIKFIENRPDEVSILYNELLIGVTNFFRDFDALQTLKEILVKYFQENDLKNEFRVWVAGCSTGEEAYSLAIMLNEINAELELKKSFKIFATDIEEKSIDLASSGIYPLGISSDIPPNLLSKYFVRKEDVFQINRSIREMVVFAQHNLIKDPPFTNIDLVSCRNLLIYLQPILQKKVMEFFNFSLVPKGVLFLGMSESIGEMADYFINTNTKYKIYSSRGKRKINVLDHDEQLDHSLYFKNRVSPSNKFAQNYQDQRIFDLFLQAIAGDFIILMMIINKSGNLVYAAGETEPFLKVTPGIISTEISKLIIKELSIPISTGIQKVLKGKTELLFKKISIKNESANLVVDMKLKPLIGSKEHETLIGIFVTEFKYNAKGHPYDDSLSYDASKEAEQRINNLEHELKFSQENLQATVEELETSNEELQSTNEELLSSNEELQSTNEELQSVNEELFTVNAELQSKITDLTELTGDLDNLIESTEIASLFLDENLEIRRYSQSINKIFNIIDSDIGRPIFDIANKIESVNLKESIQYTVSTSKVFEKDLFVDNQYYLMRILPYKLYSNVFSGVVIIFINVSLFVEKNKALSDQKFYYLSFLQTILKTENVGIWEWDIGTGVLQWSEYIEPIFGLGKGEFNGYYESYMDFIHPDDKDKVNIAVKDSLNHHKEYLVEHRIITTHEEIKWIVSMGDVIFDEYGKPLKMVGLIRDISNLKS